MKSAHNQDDSRPVKRRKDDVDQLLESIMTMEPTAQLEMWTRMINAHPFDLHQLQLLKTAIDDRIRLDIISRVPYEIASYIMSFLSPKDLCQAAQVCRSWRVVCEDNRLWREKCREEGLLSDHHTLVTLFRRRIRRSHKRHENFLKELNNVGDAEWKAAYLKHMNMLRNWRTRNFAIKAPFISAPRATPQQPQQPQQPSQPQPQQQQQPQQQPQPQPQLQPQQQPQPQPQPQQLNQQPAQPSRSQADQQPPEVEQSSPRHYLCWLDPKHQADCDGCDYIPTKRGAASKDNHLMQLRCHEDSVITCLQYNPLTNTIVSGSDDQTLKVWSSETGKCLTTLEGHTGGVWSSQLSPDDIVISGATDRTVRVWKARSGKLLHILYGHTSTVRCLALDGDQVVSGSRDTSLRLWDIKKGVCLHVFLGHSAAVRCVEYKKGVIVSGAYDHLVMVWDAATGTCKHTLECHLSRIYSLQFDGKTIASGSLDSTICIWDAESGKLRHHLEGHQSLTSKMQLKDNLLVSANADSFCKIWDVNTGQCLQTLGGEGKHTSAITSVYFNNRHVVTSSDDGTVKLWDIKTGKFVRNLIVLPTASNGGVVWRIRASYTKLICAVGSRTQTEDTHLLVLDFND